MPPQFQSIPELLFHRIHSTPQKTAYLFPKGDSWESVSWENFGNQVKALAMGLRALGLKDSECCAIQAGTCYSWILSEVAISCAAGVTTTVYPTASWEETLFILKDANIRFLFVENEEKLAQLRACKTQLPHLQHVIYFEGQTSADNWALPLEYVASLGHSASQTEFQQVWQGLQPSSLATIIYTSGTTGVPKGVELTHDGWLYEAEGIDAVNVLTSEDVHFLWLPLSHVFGKVLEMLQFRVGFSTAIDGRVDKIVDNIAHIQPTFFAVVPRILEKIRNKVIQNAKQGGVAKYKLFKWAIQVGKKVKARPKTGPLLSSQYKLAKKLVLNKVKALFGNRLYFILCGGAPLSVEVAEFFHACNVLILEGYGLTETSAVTSVNLPYNLQFGTVGPPLPGTQIKISEDGEILVKSRAVMRGYHNQPEASAQALQNGWLHTGDIGSLVEGRLQILDRRKELIKTSGGKYIAPQALENTLKAMCPYVNQVLVHGNNRSFCSALVTLETESIHRWARQNNVPTDKAFHHHPKIIELIISYINRFNSKLANFEKIRKFHILEKEFSVETGELTHSLKLKRKFIEKKYQAILDNMYAGNVLSAD
ncbi:MAG: long-chain fatty acid--CoA ligase [Proteobacteria bacterium]|nr:long-chain fatty acid--CoA ligase [Cystobacterineae bacterium]MCL2313931.1 long-chain fatty acid--CoA ligase [Pseudomonadota bacterium]